MAEKHAGGRPRKFKTVAEMDEAIEAYFLVCDARTMEVVTRNGDLINVRRPEPYTTQGLAVALDLTTKSLLDYEERDEFCSTIKKAKSRVEANKVVHMLDGDGYGAGYIFDLKNNHGWKDNRGVEHSGEITHDYSDKFRAVLDRLSSEEEDGGSQESTSDSDA